MTDVTTTDALLPGDATPAPPRRGRWKLITWVAVALVGGLAVWHASAWRGRKPPEASAPARGISAHGGQVRLEPGAPQWELIRIAQARATGSRFTDPFPARVRIDETRASRVGAPLSGRVTRVFVELGQRVERGTKLFSVASPDLAGLRAELAKAQVDSTAAKINLERIRAMVAARAVPAKEELAARQQHQQAQVALRAARARLAALRAGAQQDGTLVVTSQRAGVVVEKNLLASQEVSASEGKVLLAIADLSAVWVVADLPEGDAGEVRRGAAAMVTSPVRSSLRVNGHVENVSAVVDPERHTVAVRIRVDNPTGMLRPNMYAQVSFAIQADASSCEVPASALVSDGAQQYVYVEASKGRFSRRSIVAGAVRGEYLLILSGLKPGERVVSSGAILLDNHLAIASQ